MSARPALAVVVSAVLAGSLTACAGGVPGDIDAHATKVLAPQVQHIREVAAYGSYADLKHAVAGFESLVRREQAGGHVSSSRAVAIENAADALLVDARRLKSPTPVPTTQSPTPTPVQTTESPTPTPTTASPTPTPTTTSPTPVETTPAPPAQSSATPAAAGVLPTGAP